MRICFFGYALQDQGCGSGQLVSDISKELSSMGLECTIATSWMRRKNLHTSVRFESLNRGNSWRQKYVIFPIRATVFLFANAKRFVVIVVTASYKRLSYLFFVIFLLIRTPKIFLSLTTESINKNLGVAYDAVISTKHLGLHKREFVVPVGIDSSRFINRSPAFRSRLLSGGSRFLVGTMGSPLPRRGHMTFIKAAERVLSERDDVIFVMAIELTQSIHEGMAEELSSYRNYISDKGLQERILILGEVDVPSFLASLDLFVYPLKTTYGALDVPPTVLEVTATGTRLVTTDVGGVGEALRGSGAVIVPFADRESPAAFSAAILSELQSSATELCEKDSGFRAADVRDTARDYLRAIRAVARED